MGAAVLSVPYLMTQSEYERFVTGASFSEISKPPVDFAVDEPVIAVMEDDFWKMPKDKGYSKGRRQSSVSVEVPKAASRTNVKRKGVRK